MYPLQDRGGVQDRLSFYSPILKDCCKFTEIRVYCTFYHIHSLSPTLTSTTPQLSSADKHTQKTGVLAGTTSFHLVLFLCKAGDPLWIVVLNQHETIKKRSRRLHKSCLYLTELQLFKKLRVCINIRVRTENKISFSCSCYRPAIRGLGCLGVKCVGEGVRVNPGLNPTHSSPSSHVRYLRMQKP